MWRGSGYALAGLLCGAVLTNPVQACDLALVLAVDVSGSVDNQEYQIQMQGLAAALRDPVISEALVRSSAAVMLLQWSGSGRQKVSVPWTRIENFEDAEGFSESVAFVPREWRNFSTAIGDALSVALAAFDDVPDCNRRIIDVSGDGYSNEGIEPLTMRPRLDAHGVTVNGLAIESEHKRLTEYFRSQMITGPGAFAVQSNDFADYPEKIRWKLLRELTKQVSFLCIPPDHC